MYDLFMSFQFMAQILSQWGREYKPLRENGLYYFETNQAFVCEMLHDGTHKTYAQFGEQYLVLKIAGMWQDHHHSVNFLPDKIPLE